VVQLGRVELGGWNKLAVFRNPPPKFREREVKRFPGWLTWQALTLPRLETLRTEVERLAPGTWKVRLVVQNTGYLPTSVTQRAVERKACRGVVFEILLPEGARLAAGKPRVEIGQLQGRSGKSSLQAFLPGAEITGDRGQCEWTVVGPEGANVRVVGRHERAGRVEEMLVLR
jgi:hypothetical protein